MLSTVVLGRPAVLLNTRHAASLNLIRTSTRSAGYAHFTDDRLSLREGSSCPTSPRRPAWGWD